MKQDTKRQVKRFLKYALLGPLVGLLIIDIGLIVAFPFVLLYELLSSRLTMDFIGQSMNDFLFINVVGVFVAYYIGFIPAAMAGAAATQFNNKKTECIAAAAAGVSPIVLLGAFSLLQQSFSIAWLLLPLIAVLSTLVCALFKREST